MAKRRSDVHISQYRRPTARCSLALVREVCRELSRHESRKRARRPSDQQNWETLVSAVFSDVVYRTVQGHYRRIICPRDVGRTLYDIDAFNTHNLERLLDLSAEAKLLAIHRNPGPGLAQTLASGPKLRDMIRTYGPRMGDFERKCPGIVIVRYNKKRLPDIDEILGGSTPTLMNYQPDSRTEEMADFIDDLNAYFFRMKIEYDGPDADKIDLNDRAIQRFFLEDPQPLEEYYIRRGERVPMTTNLLNEFVGHNQPHVLYRPPSLTLFGRFHGPFHTEYPMTREHRWYLYLFGEPSVEVDYNALHPRLAYARMRAELPEGDLYDIIGMSPRNQVKRFFNSMLNTRTPFLKHYPKKIRIPGVSPREATERVLAAHPRIAPLFHTGIGLELMREESDLLVDIMKICMAREIPFLPIHDSILTNESNSREVAEIMVDCFTRKYLVPVRVTREQCGEKIDFFDGVSPLA